jgi:quercetin dioxygenase-like cupin family protein
MARRKQQILSQSTVARAERASEPDPRIRSRLLEALGGPERYTLFANDVARAFDVSVEHARTALRAIADASAWRPGAIPGSRVLAAAELAENGTVIADLPLGMYIPVHAHAERELTFVLDGALLDDAQQRFGPGELLDMPVGTAHSITVVGEHACLAVFRRVRA